MSIVYKLTSAQGNPTTIKNPNEHTVANAEVTPNVRCPHCLHMGAFTRILPQDLNIRHLIRENNASSHKGRSVVGLRVCPNNECRGIILFVQDETAKLVTLPGEVLDFDPTDVPNAIAASLEEAIKCHSAQCYKAAALMVRRVLEELCEDRGAQGKTLHDRLIALSQIIVLPRELLAAADHLRLLGNDAAHIEAKTYQAIGEPEVRLSIDLTKELLKGAYQYKGLLGRLTALQKTP